jgi:hypothetical protein
MIKKVIRLKTDDYSLQCEYSDGAIVEFDMSFIKESSGLMAKPLHKLDYFAKVFLESGSPTWPNGFDLCPESIYEKGIHIAGPKARAV